MIVFKFLKKKKKVLKLKVYFKNFLEKEDFQKLRNQAYRNEFTMAKKFSDAIKDEDYEENEEKSEEEDDEELMNETFKNTLYNKFYSKLNK